MDSSLTRIGLIGAGSVTEGYHLPALRTMPQVRIAWVADRDAARARQFAKLFGISRAATSLAEAPPVDAVLIGIPVSARAGVLQQVCERGWHALCEKPFALTTEEHRRFLALARRHGVRLAVGLQRRWLSTTAVARGLLERGSLGPPRQILAGEGMRMRRTGRGSDWYQASGSASGGVLFETGSHLVDQVFSLAAVTGFSLEHCRQIIVGGLELETSARGTVTLASGERVPFALVVSRLHDVYNGIVVRCAEGELRVPLAADHPVEVRQQGAVLPVASPAGGITDGIAAIRAEWEHLLAPGRSSEFCDSDTGLLTTEFLDGCVQAARQTNAYAAEARS